MTDWRPMHEMPSALRDGRPVRLLLASGFELLACLEDGFMGDGCGVAWVADPVEAPDCWTDGVCWASNEAEVPSDQPTHYCEIPERR